jgi:hypothetical protein
VIRVDLHLRLHLNLSTGLKLTGVLEPAVIFNLFSTILSLSLELKLVGVTEAIIVIVVAVAVFAAEFTCAISAIAIATVSSVATLISLILRYIVVLGAVLVDAGLATVVTRLVVIDSNILVDVGQCVEITIILIANVVAVVSIICPILINATTSISINIAVASDAALAS